jgi:hypothetical protein
MFAVVLVAAPLSLAGCKQQDGDRCQTDSDCDSNHCVLPAGGTAQSGGTCQSTAVDSGTSTTDDLSTTD